MILEDKDILKNMKKNVKGSFVATLLIFLFAVVLLRNPENFISVAINLFGYGAVFIGALEFVFYFRVPKEQRIFDRHFVTGLLFVSFGIVAFFENALLKSVITFLLGGYLLFQNASRTNLVLNLKNYVGTLWIFILILSGINLIGAILIMINPFEEIFPINTYVAILMIAIEILFMIQNFLILFGAKEKKEKKKEEETAIKEKE